MSENERDVTCEAAIARRRFLGLGAAAAAGTLAAPAIVRADDRLSWRMVTAWPKNSPGFGVNAQRLADSITALSGGRLSVQLLGAGELVPPAECFDAVASGAAEMGHGASQLWQGKDPAFHFFTGVPFGLFAEEHLGWLLWGGGQQLWENAYAPFGVRPFPCGSSGTRAGGWFRRPVDKVEDFRGLRMRAVGLGGDVLRRLGAEVVQIPSGEIYQAMQTGALDAAEWVGPWNDLAFGLFRVAKNYYMPSFSEPGPALELLVNKKLFDDLPDDLKEIVRRAALASAAETGADFLAHNTFSLKPLLDKEGVKVRTFSDDVVRALARETGAVLAEIAASSPTAAEIFESFEAHRRQCEAYSAVMELPARRQRAIAHGA